MSKKLLITNALIQSLNPCQDRLDNYLDHYQDQSHTKVQFLGLKNITHQDKVWVGLRLIPKENIALVAADIAESVLHIFEAKYPNDLRPRQAIEAARSGDKIKAKDAAYAAAFAAYTAANGTAAIYASAAAPPAEHAAYAAMDAANAATDVANADTNTDAYTAAHAVANTAVYANVANTSVHAVYAANDNNFHSRSKQEKLIHKIILKYWK